MSEREPGTETMTYIHEGKAYRLEYTWYPSDGPGFQEELDLVRIWRGGADVTASIPEWLQYRMAKAALRRSRLTEGGVRQPAG